MLRQIFSNRIHAAIFVVSSLVILTSGILLVLMMLSAFNVFGGNWCPSSRPSAIEDYALFTLPSSAENLVSNCGGMQGWIAVARFDMNPSDLDVFVESTHVEQPLSTNIDRLPAGVTRQDVQAMSSYLYGKANFAQYVLIDTSDASKYTVYITRWGGN